ncbi:apoptosis-associated speck-like protein containing a CARD [Astatotilapia calliptera]|uniref:apoptosis-associated speck-like protein containing a CARD n=1 Tax=Astatotilapia calliptera TaxID=8154 RepID=UPI000E408D2D|nr:apoptosis-associated speck-like protein containing a CARD [Astatotilapia calliptera]
MESLIQLLSETLGNLSDSELMDLKKGLKRKYNSAVPWRLLKVADPQDTVFLMLQAYGQQSVKKTMEVLKEMKMTDLTQQLSDSSSEPTRKHFVDKHRVQLIQRVSNIAPILDELQYKEVIDQEQYDKIRALPTSQDRMRELYSGPLKASAACKDIFYESLLANEKFLVEDLSKK